MKKLVIVLAALLMMGTVGSVGATNVFETGGDRLVGTQNTDGGWGWPLSGSSAKNTVGPIAMGLAQAYLNTGSTTQLAGLQKASAFLLTKTTNFSPSDGYLAAQLDAILGGSANVNFVKANFYDKLAAGTYDRNGAGTLYTTAGYVNLVRTNRSGTQANMAAWDVGMGLMAAAAVGADTTAWIAGTKAEINELNAVNYYDVIGLAGGVYGLAYVHETSFDPTTGSHAGASNLADLGAILASYQINNGGFAWNSNYVIPNDGNEAVQETAYSILALNEIDRGTYLSNIQGAGAYLRSAQLATGGWGNYSGSDENNEVTGEALWGISKVPEPGTLMLLGFGLVGLVAAGRRVKR